MSDQIKSLIARIILIMLSSLAAKLHVDTGASLQAFAADAADMIVLAYGVYAHWNMKKVPVNTIAVDVGTPVDKNTRSDNGGTPLMGTVVSVVGKDVKTAGTIVGAILLCLCLPIPEARAQGVASCNPVTFLKGITYANFIPRVKACSADDLKAAMDDAVAQVPPDYTAMSCYAPLYTIVNKVQIGGVFLTIQLYRDAKKAGLLLNCLTYVNTTISP